MASYLAYVVSFATIGLLWLEHAVITEYVERANAVLIRLNLLLLMVVSFIPFPTKCSPSTARDDDAGPLPPPSTGSPCSSLPTMVSVLWRYAVDARLVRADIAEEFVRDLTLRLTPGLAGYVVMICSACSSRSSPCSAISSSPSYCSCRSACSERHRAGH